MAVGGAPWRCTPPPPVCTLLAGPRSRSAGAPPRPPGPLRPTGPPLHRPHPRSVADPDLVRPALAGGSHLPGRACPPRRRDPAPVVGQGDRAHHALFARAVLPDHAHGRPAQPPGASGGRDGCLVSQEEPDLRRHARRCPPRDLAGTGFPHVPDRARGEETPTRAARRHHLRTLPRRMTATKRPNSNLGTDNKATGQPPSPFRFTLARFHEALGQSIRGGETAMDAH